MCFRSHFGPGFVLMLMFFWFLLAHVCIFPMADDLAVLISLGDLRRSRRSRGGAAAVAAEVVAHAVEELPAELADLLELQVVAAAVDPARHRHEQRSWQLCASARATKAIVHERARTADASAKKHKAQALNDAVGLQFPCVARVVGIPVRHRPWDADRARIAMRLALMPAVRGSESAAKAQQRAASVLAHTCLNLQRDFLETVFAPPIAPETEAQEAEHGCAPPTTDYVHVLEWQWDETSQKLRGGGWKKFSTEAICGASMAVEIMMQVGCYRRYSVVGRTCTLSSHEPVLCRGLRLESLAAKFLLEGLLRNMPVDVFSSDAMQNITKSCRVFMLSFCMDRAASNFKSLAWIWHSLQGASMPIGVWPHAEPCAIHGVALVKGRPRGDSLNIVGCSHTFASLMRNWRTVQELRKKIIVLVEANLKVSFEPRPPELRAKSKLLIEMLFDDTDAAWLYHEGKGGNKNKGRLLRDLEALCDVVDLGAGGVSTLTHYCVADPHGVGNARGHRSCCKDRSDSVEKVAVPILNWVCNRGWDRSSVSRWTYVSTTLRKLAVGCLAKNMLPTAVQELQLFWRLDESMVASLERMLAADVGDFSARTKLRLLRVAKCFCSPEFLWQLAVIITNVREVDRVLYGLLGDGRPESRLNLRGLLDETSGPIAACQNKFVELLQQFDPNSVLWSLFREFGGAFGHPGCKAFARRHILQLCAAWHQYFEQRMSQPPYTLLKLTDDAVGISRKRTLATQFLSTSEHCLSLFARRIKASFPTVSSLINDAGPYIKVWGESEFLAIDFSERSHAGMRLDLRSSGQGRNFTASSNRIMCQQVRSEYAHRSSVVRLGEPLPLLPGVGRDVVGNQVAPIASSTLQQPRRRHGGNPKFEHQNHKMAVHKSLHAPDRALTADERSLCIQSAKEEWDHMSEADRGHWRTLHRVAVFGRSTSAVVAVAPERPRVAPSIWGHQGSVDAQSPVHPELVLQHCKGIGAGDRRQLAQQDPSLIVDSVTDRPMQEAPFEDIFGCFAKKRGVCRHVMEPEFCHRFEGLVSLLTAWVGSLGAAVVGKAESLLWCRSLAIEGIDEPRFDMCALLVDAMYNPKVSYHCQCCLQGKDGQVQFVMPTDFPFVVCLSTRPARLSEAFRSCDMCSSDELCLELARSTNQWEFVPLEYEFLEDGSLMDMRVLRAGDAFRSAKAAPRKRKAPDADLPAEIYGDPLDYGRAAGAAASFSAAAATTWTSNSSSSGVEGVEQCGDPVSGEADIGGDDLLDQFADLGAAVMEDVRGIMLEAAENFASLGDDDAAEGIDVWPSDDFGEQAHADSESDLELEKAIVATEGAESGHEDGLVAAPSVVPSVLDLCSQAVIDENGYISCPVAPWSAWPTLARLSSWPASKPLEQRSVSVKCHMHTGCSSPAKRRAAVTNQQLLHWLFQGTPHERPLVGEMQELKRRHVLCWHSAMQLELSMHADKSGASLAGGAAASSSTVGVGASSSA